MRSTPVGMRACECVDLSKVCLFRRSCRAYGYASFIGFMVYMCSCVLFPYQVFSELVISFLSQGLLQRFNRNMGIWIWFVGVYIEGNVGRGEVLRRAVIRGKGVCLESSCGIRDGMEIGSC